VIALAEVKRIRRELDRYRAGLPLTIEEQRVFFVKRRLGDLLRLLEKQGFPASLIATAAGLLAERHPQNELWVLLAEIAGQPREEVSQADAERFAHELEALFERVKT